MEILLDNRITYSTFRQKRRQFLVAQVTPQLSEKLDRIEAQLLEKELLHRKLTAPIKQDKVSPWELFSVAELKNPITLQSFIQRLVNNKKAGLAN